MKDLAWLYFFLQLFFIKNLNLSLLSKNFRKKLCFDKTSFATKHLSKYLKKVLSSWISSLISISSPYRSFPRTSCPTFSFSNLTFPLVFNHKLSNRKRGYYCFQHFEVYPWIFQQIFHSLQTYQIQYFLYLQVQTVLVVCRVFSTKKLYIIFVDSSPRILCLIRNLNIVVNISRI